MIQNRTAYPLLPLFFLACAVYLPFRFQSIHQFSGGGADIICPFGRKRSITVHQGPPVLKRMLFLRRPDIRTDPALPLANLSGQIFFCLITLLAEKQNRTLLIETAGPQIQSLLIRAGNLVRRIIDSAHTAADGFSIIFFKALPHPSHADLNMMFQRVRVPLPDTENHRQGSLIQTYGTQIQPDAKISSADQIQKLFHTILRFKLPGGSIKFQNSGAQASRQNFRSFLFPVSAVSSIGFSRQQRPDNLFSGQIFSDLCLLLKKFHIFPKLFLIIQFFFNFAQDTQDFFRQKWLQQIILDAQRYCLLCIIKFIISADDDCLAWDFFLLQSSDQLQSAQMRHRDIRHDNIRAKRSGFFQCFPSIPRRLHFFCAFTVPYIIYQQIPYICLIIGDQYSAHPASLLYLCCKMAESPLPWSTSPACLQRKVRTVFHNKSGFAH